MQNSEITSCEPRICEFAISRLPSISKGASVSTEPCKLTRPHIRQGKGWIRRCPSIAMSSSGLLLMDMSRTLCDKLLFLENSS